ncbi:MAG: T9SS type A sorting domain-containing protein [Bacteroidales bacterium]|nr:T9SS type A sorting domain-containing protein [Bacteroidales bacterium]
MKKIIFPALLVAVMAIHAQKPTIVNHNCIDLTEIPGKWIDSAKSKLFIAYGHTSHGSQITSGMNALEKYYSSGKYNWSHDGGTNDLHLFEGSGYTAGDLDHDCGYAGWDSKTRTYLDKTPDCNVLMWSWCGQVNSVNLQDHYLTPMSQLETDYPDVTFVYMTGHLEGLGTSGTLLTANNTIRDYCKQHNKVLFDFADIEKYSPDCDTNFQEYNATDGCKYQHPTRGEVNWATEWLARNPDHELAKIAGECGSCSHSVSLNCVKKGVAIWYLWAQLAGWEGNSANTKQYRTKSNLIITPNPVGNNFMIDLPDHLTNGNLKILDMHGKIVHRHDIIENTGTVTFSNLNLPRGTYIMQFQSGETVFRTKFVK